ncbi:alpha/beta fold hydrolase [Sinorhizobium fredii]|uniref:alpha/beta fold hydrolase n=1 Tax=Rhizobium fredii TaxID=380 RepID=UPI0005955D14|nr:alpha/beta hydrolase [Sinorhizobium fredii]WOS65646.1 alpha/beta hydrolase [Sinorhizobium fredii GR64]
MKHHFLHTGDVELEWHEMGEGAPLLYLHGGQGFFPDDAFVAALARTRRVIVPSHPGFGKSSLPDWLDSVSDIAHVHLALLDYLGLDEVDVVGCSIGAWVAAEMGTMSPERFGRIVLAAPVGIKVGPVDRLDVPDIFALSQEQVASLFYHDAAKFRFDASAHSDETLTTIVRNRETLTLLTWEPYMHNPKLRHRLQRVTAPTLILRGGSDGFVSADYANSFARLIPNSSVETIEASGHNLAEERPEAFAARVEAFLAEPQTTKTLWRNAG